MKDEKNILILGLCLIVTGILLLVPTGFEGALQFREAEKCRVQVEAVDDSRLIDTGLIRSGQQVCSVRILSGKFKGMRAEGWNMLGGSLSQDKLFRPEDKVQAVIHYEEKESGEQYECSGKTEPVFYSINLIDYYRLNGELTLAIAFGVFLVAFAGATGLRSVFSFIITILSIWKILVPLYLKGVNPIATGILVVAIMTLAILSLVYGFDRRLLSSFAGSMLGILSAAFLSIVFTRIFHIHGAVMAHSESLLYSGFQDLNLTQIFMASVFIGASGSVMDLSVDITSAVNEVVRTGRAKGIQVTKGEAVRSGLAVARAAMGTMTTTLLLAYSGTCIALLMTFMAQGTPLYNILNNNIVSAEIINTIAGSFGLAMTAPFTAVIAGLVISR